MRWKYLRISPAARPAGIAALAGTLLAVAGPGAGLWILELIGLPLGVLGWSRLWAARRRAGRRARLLVKGKAVTGKVVRVEELPSGRAGRGRALVLAFEYRDDAGGRRHGRSPELPAALERRWRTGSSLRVAYDELDPELSEADIFDALVDASRP